MAGALVATVAKLVEAGIVADECLGWIQATAAGLKSQKTTTAWTYGISRETPIRFSDVRDENGRIYNPEISARGVQVGGNPETYPFVRWDIALTLRYQDPTLRRPRWHFDLANDNQLGPKMHLQYGGQAHEDPSMDEQIEVPRWNTMPMDVVLLCEMVAANFYSDVWNGSLRTDTSLKRYIKASEQLCYPYLLNRMKNAVDASGCDTVLDQCWNDYQDR